MSDCISREDALLCLTGKFEKNKEYSPEELIAMFGKRIQKLPPVTPQLKIGHDTVSREVIAYKEAIRKIMEGLEEYLEEYNYVDETGNHELKWCAISEAKMLVEDRISEACEIIDSGRTMEMEESLESSTELTDLPTELSTDDCISRSDMLDAVGHGSTYTSEELQEIIRRLPSAKS